MYLKPCLLCWISRHEIAIQKADLAYILEQDCERLAEKPEFALMTAGMNSETWFPSRKRSSSETVIRLSDGDIHGRCML